MGLSAIGPHWNANSANAPKITSDCNVMQSSVQRGPARVQVEEVVANGAVEKEGVAAAATDNADELREAAALQHMPQPCKCMRNSLKFLTLN